MTEDQSTNAPNPMKDTAAAVGSVAADLQAAAVRTFDSTVAEVKSQANDAKANVANDVKDVAMALRRASEDLRGGSAQERTLGQIASTLADASDSLRDKDLGEIMQEASRVARDNPMLFLGGAVLLGFAASRYAKASSDRANIQRSSHVSSQSLGEGTGKDFAFAGSADQQSDRQQGLTQ